MPSVHNILLHPALVSLLFLPLVSCAPPHLSIYDPPAAGQIFKLQEDIIGDAFYNTFDFETLNDPTHGRVNYVDKDYATSHNLTFTSKSKFVMRADSTNVVQPGSRGRDSIRLSSKREYSDSVIVLDLAHMPAGCATWPAFRTRTSDAPAGVIDIIEGVNNQSPNLASLHTTPNCSMQDVPRKMFGQVEGEECDSSKNSNKGCGVKFSKATSFGQDFNRVEGGWFAMRRTKKDGISIWLWSRSDPSVPGEVRRGAESLHTESWGSPEAAFPADNCDMESHFGPHRIVFSLTFCGDWAGNSYAGSGCPGSCVDLVDNNPGKFVDAYWEINSLRTYV